MVIPGLLIVFIYHYIPLIGVYIAFENFIPAKGVFGKQDWIGLTNIINAAKMSEMQRAAINTLIISSAKIALSLIVPLIISLMLNEVRRTWYKRTIQTLIYLPYFFSWVILAVIFREMFSSTGMVNNFLALFGLGPFPFLTDPGLFRDFLIVTDTWKGFGYNTILYLAALTAIDPTLYESAVIDGASRWKQTIHITIPGISGTIVLLLVLGLGSILNSAGFDQIYNLYNGMVYETSDVIDTIVYRMGIINAQYSLSTAIGLAKSVISCILVSVSYWAAGKFANYRIF